MPDPGKVTTQLANRKVVFFPWKVRYIGLVDRIQIQITFFNKPANGRRRKGFRDTPDPVFRVHRRRHTTCDLGVTVGLRPHQASIHTHRNRQGRQVIILIGMVHQHPGDLYRRTKVSIDNAHVARRLRIGRGFCRVPQNCHCRSNQRQHHNEQTQEKLFHQMASCHRHVDLNPCPDQTKA